MLLQNKENNYIIVQTKYFIFINISLFNDKTNNINNVINEFLKYDKIITENRGKKTIFT